MKNILENYKQDTEECGLVDYLIELLESDQNYADEDATFKTFSEAGLLTNDNGFVIKTGGKEYQITVVRSK